MHFSKLVDYTLKRVNFTKCKLYFSLKIREKMSSQGRIGNSTLTITTVLYMWQLFKNNLNNRSYIGGLGFSSWCFQIPRLFIDFWWKQREGGLWWFSLGVSII